MTRPVVPLVVLAAGVALLAVLDAAAVVGISQDLNGWQGTEDEFQAMEAVWALQAQLSTVLPWLVAGALLVAVAALALAALQAGSTGAATRTRMAPGSVQVEKPTTRPNSSPSSSNSSSRSSWTVKRDAVR